MDRLKRRAHSKEYSTILPSNAQEITRSGMVNAWVLYGSFESGEMEDGDSILIKVELRLPLFHKLLLLFGKNLTVASRLFTTNMVGEFKAVSNAYIHKRNESLDLSNQTMERGDVA